jgi:hypothetical protein
MEITVRVRRGSGTPQPGETGRKGGNGRPFSRYLGVAVLGTALVLTFSFADKVRAARDRPAGRAGAVLEVTSLSLSRTGGLAVVAGSVTNLSSEPREYIWVQVRFEDAQGNLVSRSDDTLIESTTLAPYESAAFRAYGVWSPAIARCGLEFTHMIRRRLPVLHASASIPASPRR